MCFLVIWKRKFATKLETAADDGVIINFRKTCPYLKFDETVKTLENEGVDYFVLALCSK